VDKQSTVKYSSKCVNMIPVCAMAGFTRMASGRATAPCISTNRVTRSFGLCTLYRPERLRTHCFLRHPHRQHSTPSPGLTMSSALTLQDSTPRQEHFVCFSPIIVTKDSDRGNSGTCTPPRHPRHPPKTQWQLYARCGQIFFRSQDGTSKEY
jgi:hypothetical protein